MDIYLLIVTLLAITIVILGVSWWKWHAFISLTVASLFLAIMSGLNVTKIVTAYETGVGSVLGHLVGILALGTILGKMMSDSGAGMQVADFFIRFFGVKKLPWAMLFAGFVIGIPVFLKWGLSFYYHSLFQFENDEAKYIINCVTCHCRIIYCSRARTTTSRGDDSNRYL